MAAVRSEHLHGVELYGNDLTGPDLQRWYDEEEKGFFGLWASENSEGEAVFELDTAALNRYHASFLPPPRR